MTGQREGNVGKFVFKGDFDRFLGQFDGGCPHESC